MRQPRVGRFEQFGRGAGLFLLVAALIGPGSRGPSSIA
jgi:hypothetical protein